MRLRTLIEVRSTSDMACGMLRNSQTAWGLPIFYSSTSPQNTCVVNNETDPSWRSTQLDLLSSSTFLNTTLNIVGLPSQLQCSWKPITGSSSQQDIIKLSSPPATRILQFFAKLDCVARAGTRHVSIYARIVFGNTFSLHVQVMPEVPMAPNLIIQHYQRGQTSVHHFRAPKTPSIPFSVATTRPNYQTCCQWAIEDSKSLHKFDLHQ